MAEVSTIEWTDATWNPITGCTLESDGCRNCYAAALAEGRLRNHPSRKGLARRNADGVAKFTGEVRFNRAWLTQPLSWRRGRMVFVCAHADLFHPDVPDEWIDQVFAVMALAPQHTFQVLTKRPARMREYLTRVDVGAKVALASVKIDAGSNVPVFNATWPLPNVWLGTSVEDQAAADKRIPELLATPAAVRFVSAEPLLGPVDFDGMCDGYKFYNPLTGARWHDAPDDFVGAHDTNGPRLDWVIAGGESGAHARPSHPDWFRALRDQCAEAGVPFLFKQWGAWAPGDAFGLVSDGPVTTKRGGEVRDWMKRYVVCGDRADRLDGYSFTDHATNLVYRVGKKRAGRLLDGVIHDGMPGRVGPPPPSSGQAQGPAPVPLPRFAGEERGGAA